MYELKQSKAILETSEFIVNCSKIRPLLLPETTMPAAVGDANKGTLHIILNSGDDSAFRVSAQAMDFRTAAGREAALLTSSAAWPTDTEVGFVDSRVAATAVTAQIMSLTHELLEAGDIPASSYDPAPTALESRGCLQS